MYCLPIFILYGVYGTVVRNAWYRPSPLATSMGRSTRGQPRNSLSCLASIMYSLLMLMTLRSSGMEKNARRRGTSHDSACCAALYGINGGSF